MDEFYMDLMTKVTIIHLSRTSMTWLHFASFLQTEVELKTKNKPAAFSQDGSSRDLKPLGARPQPYGKPLLDRCLVIELIGQDLKLLNWCRL